MVAGRRAGVTRLADVSGLTPFGVPVFQAIRPCSRSLSVSQGKGLTPMAAKVSALLEAAELAVAETLALPDDDRTLSALSADAQAIWSSAIRGRGAIRLDPSRSRRWLSGTCLLSGRTVPVPWDLIALDYTRQPEPDACASSSGLATGNTADEATVAAVAELLERDLTAMFERASRRERRDLEVDPDSMADPTIRALLSRIVRAGYDVRLWSLGQPVGIAALRCAIFQRGRATLPPTVGSGCHPSRRVATLRAVLEAVQVHATLVAGARDDLHPADYADPDGQKLDLIFETLSLAPAIRTWSDVPDQPYGTPAKSLDRLLAITARRSSLPVVRLEHDSGVPGLVVARVVAPGLTDSIRNGKMKPLSSRPARLPMTRRRPPPVVFVGPTLATDDLPPGLDVRPPAMAGDLAALLDQPPAAVGLIDGCFETAPSVWHKEILHLLALGTPVLGGASLGAIRAAELDAFGMVGIGAIYAAYRDGSVRRDDAVMLTHAPAELGFLPLTVALVDAEAAIAAVRMPAADRRLLQRIARTTHYAARNWEHCLARFEEVSGRPAPISAAALFAQPSLKRADALELLAALAKLPNLPAMVPRPMPPMTSTYARLLARVTPARS